MCSTKKAAYETGTCAGPHFVMEKPQELPLGQTSRIRDVTPSKGIDKSLSVEQLRTQRGLE